MDATKTKSGRQMNLRNVMEIPVEQDLKVLHMKFHLTAMRQTYGPHHIEVLIEQGNVKVEQARLIDLQIERDWLLVKGQMDGEWVQCARSHDCYTEDLLADTWRERMFLGQPYWLCSAECETEWWATRTAKALLTSKRTEVTFESGKKAILTTPGQSLNGFRGPSVEMVTAKGVRYARAEEPSEASAEPEPEGQSSPAYDSEALDSSAAG
jgi:hypothetical protein